MAKVRSKISPFRLSSLLRLQKDPKLALQLFLNPNQDDHNSSPNPKRFRYSPLSYDLILCKLGRAKMFNEMEMILEKLRQDARIVPKEIIFCNIIAFYGRSRLHQKALQMFDEIPSFRCQRTIKSVNSLLNSLLNCGKFDQMRDKFLDVETYEVPDVCTFNILIHSCCVRGDLTNAWHMYDEMRKRGIEPNVTTFGTLINGLCAHFKLEEALKLKKMMERDFRLKPNAFVYVPLIKGLCRNSNDLDKAIKLKEEMVRKEVKLDAAVYSTLISAYFKAGRKEDAVKLLDDMKKNQCKMNEVTYNAMIHGYCLEKDFDSAFHLLNEMEGRGCKPDVFSFSVIIRALCMEGKTIEAKNLFEDMPRRGCSPDVVTYRTFFDGLYQGMQFKEAALILDEMVFKGHLPRASSIYEFICGIIKSGDTEFLLMVLNSLAKGNFSDAVTWGAVVSTVCKCDGLVNSFGLLDTLVMGNTHGHRIL